MRSPRVWPSSSDEGLALELVDVVDGADVGVIESGGCLRLAPEPLQGMAVAGYFFGKELQGDGMFHCKSQRLSGRLPRTWKLTVSRTQLAPSIRDSV
jgi:hypothetical protein